MPTLGSFALIQLEDVREALQFETAEAVSENNLLVSLINRTSSRMETYCGRNFKVREYTEYQDGDGTPTVFTDHYPITSVSSLWDDTEREFTDSSNDLLSSADYMIYSDEGSIRLYNDETTFNKGYQNIKITYSGGYETLPGDLEEACLDWVLTLYRKIKDRTHGYMTKSASGASVLIDLKAIPESVKAVLDSYRKPKVNLGR